MKKSYIIIGLILILLLYVGSVVYLYTNENTNKNADKESGNYLFLSNRLLLQYNNGSFNVATNDVVKNLKMYSHSHYMGDYMIKLEDESYDVYDSHNLEYSNEGEPLFGYTENKNIHVQNFQIEEMSDEDIDSLKRVLQKMDIKGYSNLNSYEKVSFDFDHDGSLETLYAASNAFLEDTFDKVFSVIYIVDNNSEYILYKESAPLDDLYSVGQSYIHTIVDIDGNSVPEIIVGCNYFSELGTRYLIYNYQNGEVQEKLNILK